MHVLAEAGDIVAQVSCQVRGIGKRLLEIVARGVVEGESGNPSKLRIEVLKFLFPQLGLLGENLLLGAGQHAVDRRRIVSGIMTSWYLPGLKVSRIRPATPQEKLTISPWFKVAWLLSCVKWFRSAVGFLVRDYNSLPLYEIQKAGPSFREPAPLEARLANA